MRYAGACACILIGLFFGGFALWHNWAVALLAVIAVAMVVGGLAGFDVDGKT